MSRKGSGKKARTIVRRTAPGSMPGVLKVDPDAPKSSVRAMAYGPKEFEERRLEEFSQIEKMLAEYPVTWVHVEGLGTAETLQQIGALFDLHALALEDVVNVHQRAKFEHYGEQLFMVARAPVANDRVSTEQISVFVGKGFVVSFQESDREWFEPVLDRIRNAKGRIRTAGPDHLAHALLDAVVDHYFPVLELYGERLENLEEDVIARPVPATSSRIHEVKLDLLTLRRSIWPLRDALNSLLRDQSPPIRKDTATFFRDCYDHVVQILDHLEVYREMGSGLMDVYLSSTSNRMNEIMKVLTMIATIFIPLSFVAGLYGMNFKGDKSPLNMPELDWYFGYPFALLVMLAIAVGFFFFFRKKGWLGRGG